MSTFCANFYLKEMCIFYILLACKFPFSHFLLCLFINTLVYLLVADAGALCSHKSACLSIKVLLAAS